MKRDPFKLRIPFFRPRWRRVAVTGACLGWAGLELALGNPVWCVIFGAIGLYLAYEFFVIFDPEDYED
ncbi:MAG: hypothetical protein OIF48_04815 [Silicimonas sp.]|nr:hypothetical protein [Silicimonas sp.]